MIYAITEESTKIKDAIASVAISIAIITHSFIFRAYGIVKIRDIILLNFDIKLNMRLSYRS